MNDIFQFFFTNVISICSFTPFMYMIGISAVLCVFGLIDNKL